VKSEIHTPALFITELKDLFISFTGLASAFSFGFLAFRSLNSVILQFLDEKLRAKGIDWHKEDTEKAK
jgi:hypothetical protein